MKPAGSYRKLLTEPSFIFYLITQFITAFNDNAFKIVVMLIALQTPESGYVDKYYIAAQLVFTLPFFLFSGYAGYLADRYAKNKVIVATKVLEIIIMFLAMYFLAKEHKAMLIVILFLLSTQSVFLSPAKYGILPEWFTEKDISRANGLVELLTFLAIIIGSAIGGILMQILGNDLLLIGIILLVLAIIGFVTSLGVKEISSQGERRKVSLSPAHEIIAGIKVIIDNRLLATTIAGISFFFAMGLAVTTNLMVFGKEIFDLTEMQLGLINASMGLGIGIGSIVAGWLSGDKIELGLIPMGALGLTATIFGISFATTSVISLYILLGLCGFFAGLFIVPLNALLQELPAIDQKGRLIATNNFFNGAAMVFAVLFIGSLQYLQLAPDGIMFVLACCTAIFSVIALSFNPRFFVRFIILSLTQLLYRIDVVGRPNIPKEGPALIVSNHVSYIDGLVLSSVFPRFIRYLAHSYYYHHPVLNPLMRFAYAIPIESGSPDKVAASIERARQALKEGHVVCIFAEGRLTRTGNLLPFKAGLEQIMEGLDVPIIPVHLDQLWDSFFSPRRENQAFRVPQQFPVRITLTLGDPLPASSKAWQVRQAVQELAVQARISGHQREHYLSVEFFKAATAYPYKYGIYNEDMNISYRYGRFSSQVLRIAHKLKKIHCNEERVGVLLPSSYKSVLLNIALVTAGKSVVNIPLDYTYEQILEIKTTLGIRNIYTFKDNEFEVGKILLAQCNAIDIELVVDYINGFTNKLKMSLLGVLKYIMPVKYAIKLVGKLPDTPESEVCVSIPGKYQATQLKYITLSHEGVYNNISGIKQVLQFSSSDRFACLLALHNPFAYTANLWGAAVIGAGIVPLDIEKNHGDYVHHLHKQQTSLIILNKSILTYCLDNCPVNLLGYIKQVICIDDIDEELLAAFEDKFGLQVLISAGLAELGPFITLNVPNVRQKGMLQRGTKKGSVGHPLPNVAVRIIDPLTGEVLAPGEEGLLEIKTASYMSGYVEEYIGSTTIKPSLIEKVDQWFRTNLNATIDEEGFVFIKQT